MKKIIIFLCLSFPILSFGQYLGQDPSVGLKSDSALINNLITSNNQGYEFQQQISNKEVSVYDKNQKLIAEVDTCGNLHVYSDTTLVLKTIIRSYGIKVN